MTDKADPDLYAKLAELNEIIRLVRAEIAVIRPEDMKSAHIPQATDELDAVIASTEDATNKIMDVCDEITQLAKEVPPETATKLIACTTHIYEACNFQDITGQRIAKVVNALKQIDTKVEVILKALGGAALTAKEGKAAVAQVDYTDEKNLLNGPQLVKDAPNQDDIDRILNNN